MIRDAQETLGRPLDLLVSPWSPPAWMKTNGDMNQGGQLLPEHRAAWAEHYVLFIKALQAEGFSVWGLTVQNEPDARQQWDSCLYTAEQERDFIRDYLGPALHAAGLFPVRILCWDHNRDNLYHRAHTILGDPEAARYVWGSGFHWYTVDWNLALDTDGGPNHVGNYCSAPALVNTAHGRFEWQPAYYALGHFARLVPPGSVRILSVAGLDALLHVAFERPDGQLALILMNTGRWSGAWSPRKENAISQPRGTHCKVGC